MEELIYKFNVDHEFFLYDKNYNPNTPKARAINEEFEYLFFYLEPEKKLETRKFYSREFLDSIKKISGKQPKIVKEGGNTNYWGSISDIELAQKLNNKLTFYESLKKLGLDNRTYQIISTLSEYDFKNINKTIIVKYPKSLSGKGNLKISSFDSFVLKEKKIKTWLEITPIIVEEYIEREVDFGVSVDKEGNFQIYENKIGSNFQYTGSKVNPTLLKAVDTEHIKRLIYEYKSLGITGPWSIDGFIAKDNRVILHEVNARASMGMIFLKLKELYFKDVNHFEFTIFPQRKMKYFSSLEEINEKFKEICDDFILLSPLGNQFFVFCHTHYNNQELLELIS